MTPKTPAKRATTKKTPPAAITSGAPKTRGQKAGADITLALRARCSGFWVTTRDESRAEQDLIPAIANAGYRPRFWDLANGVTGVDGKPERGNPEFNAPEDPDQVLDGIGAKSRQKMYDSDSDRNVWILRDLSPWLEGVAGALTMRKLRNLLRPDALSGTPRNTAQAIIVLSASATPPPELADALTVIEWPLPDREEIGVILDGAVEVLPDALRTKVQLVLKNGARDSAIDAAVGLSSQEVQTTFAKSLIGVGTIDPVSIAAEKKRLIGKGGVLEWMEPLRGGMDAVGGLENLKAYMTSHAVAYTAEARAYGLKPSQGVLLLGIPGCGKTMSARAIAAALGWPLVRLDLGAQKSKYVGESEATLRKTLAQIDAIGQLVVLMDEIEKALAGATGGDSDGGVSADALGTILSWMQDRQGEAFVIATANNVEALPPELLRKGRFSEIFWVDLPNHTERESVLEAALRSHGRDADTLGIDTQLVAEATDTFSGAEIAELVPEAMFIAFPDGGREITTDDLLVVAEQIVPMARTSSEKINRLRDTWSGRARQASRADRPQQATVTRGTRQLDLQ